MEASPPYLLGVDAGGTKTLGALATSEGRIVRTARRGPGNAAVLGTERLAARLREVLDELLAGEPPASVRAMGIGLAGVGRPAERDRVRAIGRELGVTAVTVVTDGALHFAAAHERDPGILLAAGTGSICTVRNAAGEHFEVGGWGYLLGDEGSGYALGRAAVRATLFEHEQAHAPSALTAALCAHYRVDDVPGLVSRVYGSDTPQALLADAADLVGRAFEDGDPDAAHLVEASAADLVALLARGLERLDTPPPHPVVLRGGLLADPSPITAVFRKIAGDAGLELDYRTPRRTPVGAALAIAKETAGEPADASFLERIDEIEVD